MPNDILNKVAANSDKLVSLIQKENRVGFIYNIDYDDALVLTNDRWKQEVGGVPQNAFLIATLINPDSYANTSEFEQEVILLRVNGSCKLPQDDDIIRTKLDSIQNKTATFSAEQPDVITQNVLQYSGLKCRVLGTFYMKKQDLQLGSDIENFSSSMTQVVYLPKGEALKTIVNYVDPIRAKKSNEDFKKMGINGEVEPFEIGTVRYTSSDRLQRKDRSALVPVFIQPADFLARRTAVLGMTRTGKSNMVKQTVSVVKKVSRDANLQIGQLIFDINGEYANANKQDNGAISDIFEKDCVRYRMMKTEGFKNLLNNFYERISEGFSIICDQIKNDGNASSGDIQNFMTMSFDEPDPKDVGLHNRWLLKSAIYRCLLYRAEYDLKVKDNYCVLFAASKGVRDIVKEAVQSKFRKPNDSETKEDYQRELDKWYLSWYKITLVNDKMGLIKMPISKACEWFLKVREINKINPILSTSGDDWLNGDCKAMLNMLAQSNDKDQYIRGYRILINAKEFHSCDRDDKEVYGEIYKQLQDGKIVILDLSVGIAKMRDRISSDLARYIFTTSMNTFTEGKNPPHIMIYIEEAHNLIGKGMPLTEMWPRIAKEGAKYKIGLVYATQEVSSVHPNILSNTENWFVSHLNSENEIKELDKFYDFADFHKSLLRAQDVGFTRVKTLSSSFVVPVQINKFDPEEWRNK
ncbi:MAG: DUF87 domain-containing protein [Bacteroidales bacterium]|nr:DUF87 domain-containing protein [Bacteroidales bacterium]